MSGLGCGAQIVGINKMTTREQIWAAGYAIPGYDIQEKVLRLSYHNERFDIPADEVELVKTPLADFRLVPIASVREWQHGR